MAEALGELVRLRPDATVYAHGTRTASGLRVTLELSSRELASGRWGKGGEARVSLTRAGAEPVTVTAPLPPGSRSVVLDVPLEAAGAGPWRTRNQLVAGGYTLDQPLDIGEPASGPLGEPLWFRGAAAASAPMRPAAERLFRRTERLRVEWPVRGAVDSRTARVLDRRGEPLALAPTATDADRGGERVIAVDVALAPLADGDYLIELVAAQGATSVRRLVAFRVTR